MRAQQLDLQPSPGAPQALPAVHRAQDGPLCALGLGVRRGGTLLLPMQRTALGGHHPGGEDELQGQRGLGGVTSSGAQPLGVAHRGCGGSEVLADVRGLGAQ